VQDYLARPILIENPSSYLSYRHSTIPEGEFLAEVARRSGAGLLLDVNNLYVSSYNLGFDPLVYLQSIPAERVMEFHLAGHTKKVFPDGSVLIDDHASPVSNGVWHLYRQTVQHLGARPTLIEWDQELPALDVLLHQAQLAQTFLEYDHERLA
jgi:hypothetical protein